MKVSIVIPVFNGAEFLAEAIDSALDQTYRNIEVIVVNDGSNDGGKTETVARAYGDRIRYFEKENGGVASALNLAIAHASGEYVSWLSHDDLYEQDKIERQIRALPDRRTILYGDCSTFTNDPQNQIPVRLESIPPSAFRYWITTKSDLHGCTLLVPVAAFRECGGFDVSLKTTQDYDLWFRLSEKFSFVHLPYILVKARHHANQGSRTMQGIAYRECNELCIKFIQQLRSEDLAVSGANSTRLAYAIIAGIMTARGFKEAARFARQAAIRNWLAASIRENIAVFECLIRGVVKPKVDRVARRFARGRASLMRRLNGAWWRRSHQDGR